MKSSDPVEAIEFRMEQMSLTRKDLEPLVGPRGRVTEVIKRRRPLWLAMIRKLHQGLRIPLESLIQNPLRMGANNRFNRLQPTSRLPVGRSARRVRPVRRGRD